MRTPEDMAANTPRRTWNSRCAGLVSEEGQVCRGRSAPRVSSHVIMSVARTGTLSSADLSPGQLRDMPSDFVTAAVVLNNILNIYKWAAVKSDVHIEDVQRESLSTKKMGQNTTVDAHDDRWATYTLNTCCASHVRLQVLEFAKHFVLM